MSKKQEERFYYFETVSALKQFLLEKKRRLIREKGKKNDSEEEKRKLQKYLNILERVLTSHYFSDELKHQKVYQLMQKLKEDDVILKKRIESLQKKVEEMKQYLETTEDFSIPEDYAIADERKDLEEALWIKRKEYEWEIALIQEEMREMEMNLSICRNLKGMICRPHGFFDAVLH